MGNIKIENSDITLKLGSSAVTAAYLGSTMVYGNSQNYDYLTFTATESGTFKLNGNNVNYSLDSGETWTELASNTNSPTVSAGNKIMWKATLVPDEFIGVGKFSSTANFTVEGSIMSLLYGDNFNGQKSLYGKDYAFFSLFSDCTGMTSAENLILPATSLANYCYSNMFYGCTSLTTAPVLPATTLAEDCYAGMFLGCASLLTAPVLPAKKLTKYCYMGMFASCASLTSVTCLATYISGTMCTDRWLANVAASGTFTKAASMLGWSTGVSGIPSNWTVVDAS